MTPIRPRSSVERLQLAAICLGLLALTLSQQPGLLIADTKLDLVTDPWGFLGRALHLWEPDGYAGQVQNQAYGYLFPMGPFFGLGQSLGLPGWVTQRLWIAAVLTVAFLGVLALARRLRIGTPATQVIAALAYALAPRIVGEVGSISIEALPMAMAPWVLVPLVTGAERGSPRRAAALSGLAVFCVGGVNAAATAAVLPLAALYLLTRTPGPRRRALMGWWAVSVAAAVAWWAGPLLLLGRYSPPFLSWIESASTTTSPAELTQALRGTTRWLAFLATPAGPISPAGWALVHGVLPVAATLLLTAAGLVALTRHGLRERTWLVLGVLTGLVLVTAGFVGDLDGLFAGPLRQLLDGPLAPLRNTHKFEPVLRLPLVLGLAHLLAVVSRARTAWRSRVAPGVVLLAVAGVASPALAGDLSPRNAFSGLPDYWARTADWLATEAPTGRALLLPGSIFGTYVWGNPNDEPLQPLARSAWDVRSAVPLTEAGHIRVLDTVEQRLAEGRGSAGLAPYLARAGFTHLVVRNDLDVGATGSVRPALVHQALAGSPGITRVASFGPTLFATTRLPGLVYDGGLTSPLPAVEVYAVADPAPRVWTAPLSAAVTVTGGPDELLALEDRGIGAPALLAGGERTGPLVGGDALVRREHAFGRITDSSSAGLTADDPLRTHGPVPDYELPDNAAQLSTVRIDGARPSASSSGSDVDNVAGALRGQQPFAAIDGDPGTSWRPAGELEARSQWWRMDLPAPTDATAVTVLLDPALAAQAPSRVRVRTDGGEVVDLLDRTTAAQRLPLPAGATSSVTLTFDPVRDAAGNLLSPVVGLAEVQLAASAAPAALQQGHLAATSLREGGLAATPSAAGGAAAGGAAARTVVLPAAAGDADVYAFDAAAPARSGCLTLPDGAVRCSSGLVRTAEEPGGLDRTFALGSPAAYSMTVTALPRPGPALDRLIAGAARGGLTAEASSAAVPDPRGSATAAVDGDPATSWTAAGTDRDPRLELRWATPSVVDRIRVAYTPGTAAALPAAVTVRADGQERTAFLDGTGLATFAPLTTDHLTVRFPVDDELSTYDPYLRATSRLGVGVSEVTIPGVAGTDPAFPVTLGCGDGPPVTLGGVRHETELTTTVAAVRALQPVQLRLCDTGTAALDRGPQRFVAATTPWFVPVSATLTRIGGAAAVPATRTAVATPVWDKEHRELQLPARSEPTLLVVPENANPGWVATLTPGVPLPTRTVDGWQQAWLLPPGPAATATLDFTPGQPYRVALLVGLALVLLLLLLAALPVRHRLATNGTSVHYVWTNVPFVAWGRPGRGGGGGRIAGVAAVGAVALCAGVAGLVAVLAVGVVARFRRGVLPALAAAGEIGAGLALAGGPDLLALRQILSAVAVAAVVVALLLPGTRRRPPGPPPEPAVRVPAQTLERSRA